MVWAWQRLATNKSPDNKTSSRVLNMEDSFFFCEDIEQPIQSHPWEETTWMEPLRLTAELFDLDLDGCRIPR
jgi:hypothetical protein